MTKEELIKEINDRKAEIERSKPRHKKDIAKYIRKLERELYKHNHRGDNNG